MAEYIEREAAYEDFEKCNSENPKWTPSRVKTLIARQKAADVAPVRHGRWVKIDTTGLCGDPVWNCSSCGYPAGVSVAGRDYCPDCGAKMDLEDQV